ncbi:MAG: TrmH family RNA methyltransferase [Anaerolineales bacterium]
MSSTTITSPSNPRIKHVVRLRQRRHREAEGVMVIEGADELALALASGVQPITVFHCPELARGSLHVSRFTHLVEFVEVSKPVFEKIAYRENPDGWLAIAPALRRGLAELDDIISRASNALLLVVVGVEKPGNLGAMLRTADTAGVDALIVCDPATDFGNPNVVRASRGALFTVPVAQAKSTEVLNWLKALNMRIVAATPGASVDYTEVDMRGPIAIAVGAEDTGLSDEWLRRADAQVRIPMVGKVNSLNVSASAALLLYEAVRQRAEPLKR